MLFEYAPAILPEDASSGVTYGVTDVTKCSAGRRFGSAFPVIWSGVLSAHGQLSSLRVFRKRNASEAQTSAHWVSSAPTLLTSTLEAYPLSGHQGSHCAGCGKLFRCSNGVKGSGRVGFQRELVKAPL